MALNYYVLFLLLFCNFAVLNCSSLSLCCLFLLVLLLYLVILNGSQSVSLVHAHCSSLPLSNSGVLKQHCRKCKKHENRKISQIQRSTNIAYETKPTSNHKQEVVFCRVIANLEDRTSTDGKLCLEHQLLFSLL